jgi:methionyl-tRNA formyltransferase
VTTEAIRPTDTAGELLERLAHSGAELLRATVDGIAAGRLNAVPQSGDGVSYAPKLTPDDARVDWHAPALRVDRLVRACTPAPGAWTTYRDERIKLGPVRPCATGRLEPGALRVEKAAVLVGTADRDVQLGTVQAPGKRAVPAPDWARGARLDAAARFA